MTAADAGEGRHAARPNDPVQATAGGTSDDTLEVRPSPGQTVEVRPAAEGVPSRPTVRDDEDDQGDEDVTPGPETRGDVTLDGAADEPQHERKSSTRPLLGPGSTGPRTAPTTDAVTSVEAPELDTMPGPATP